jgi:outer membrane lipoprotein-sorting protein
MPDIMKSFLFVASLVTLTAGLSADPIDSAILKTIDAQVSFLDSDFSAEVSLVHETPGQPTDTNTVALFRRDKDSKYLMLFLLPESDKGKGYLKVGDNLWFYDPSSRRFTVTNAHDRFQNTNARNSDFTQSTLALDYAVVSGKAEKLGKLDTQVMELKAIRDGVPYPTAKIWVTPDNLVRKTEDYSASGQLLRIIAVPSYQKVGSRFVPVSMVVADTLRKDKTQITIAKPSLQKVSDLAFTQAYLEKAGQ